MKLKFFLFSVLTIVIFSFTSCSGSDDEPTPQPFLEKYDGTKWILKSIDNVAWPDQLVMRINNNINKPFEGWEYWGCYYYEENFMVHSPGDITIIENENDILVYKVNDWDGTLGNGIITANERTLKQKVEWEPNFTTIFIWIKSTIDVDNLTPLCNP